MRLKRSKVERCESGERVWKTTGEEIGWVAGRLVRLEWDEHGDLGEGGEPVVELDLAGLEEAVGAGLYLDHGADGEAWRKTPPRPEVTRRLVALALAKMSSGTNSITPPAEPKVGLRPPW